MKSNLIVFAGLLLGCASSDAPGSAAAELGVARPQRLQAGTRLVVYGVTDDEYAIYQDGPTLFATALHPGGAPRRVADVGTTQPVVLISGRVALVWTQQFYFGGGGVSPLVVWTAEDGPRLASSASAVSFVGTQAAAVRPDGEEILFVTNASADGTVGDIASASPDLRSVRTLVAGVSLGGACPPLVGYDGKRRPDDDARAHPVIGFCPAGATAGTLARFADGRRSDLATGLALPPTWSSDRAGARFFTIVGAGRTPVTVDAAGTVTTLEEATTLNGFIDFDDSVVTRAVTPAGRELHRFAGAGAQTIASLGATGLFYVGHHAEGFRHYTDIAASADGRLMMFADARDPATGLTDLFLVDVTRPAPVQLQSALVAAQSFELFTSDSTHALYYTVDVTTGGATLHAASLAGDDRAVSSGAPTEFAHFAMSDGLVVYSDRLDGTGVDLLDRNDIVLADVGAARLAPVTLAAGAYNLFFPTPERDAVVYTSDHDPAATGLFIVRVR